MNNTRRKEVKSIIEALLEIKARIDIVADEEQDAFDNLPEGLQCSMRGEDMEEAASNLADASDTITEALDLLEEVT